MGIGAFIGAVAAGGGVWLLTANHAPVDPTTSMLETQYARGFYDSCISVQGVVFEMPKEEAIESCVDITIEIMATGWYDQPSPGFQWPE